MLKKFLKNENGSITLFVLLAILFFLIVIFSVFLVSSNKKQAQTSEVDKIKQEYEKSINNIDQIYNETLTENLSNLLKIGDYVNYTYDTVSSGYNLPATQSGYDTDQTISQTTNLKWRILSINEDGTVDLISETPTNQEVFFKGALGYNNGVLLMNDICAEQYSNKELEIIARSINLEDIESQMSDEGVTARNTFQGEANIQYGNTKTYGDGYKKYPDLYARENGSGIDTNSVKINGIDINANGIAKEELLLGSSSSEAETSLTATQTYYDLAGEISYFNNNNLCTLLFEIETNYWIASRYVDNDLVTATFGLRNMHSSGIYGHYMFSSNRNISELSRYIRPVLSLDITQIQPCTGTADGTDTTIAHMHQIQQ